MLGADRYRLNATEQDQLARDLLKRSRNLSFNNLEILDFEGHRVARSPVIGETMIIFERTSEVVAEMDRIAAEEAAAEEAAAAKAVVEDTFPDDTLSSEGAAAEDAISPDDAMSNDVILESATSGALVQDDAIPDSSKSAS
jgi:hypothetical protein